MVGKQILIFNSTNHRARMKYIQPYIDDLLVQIRDLTTHYPILAPLVEFLTEKPYQTYISAEKQIKNSMCSYL